MRKLFFQINTNKKSNLFLIIQKARTSLYEFLQVHWIIVISSYGQMYKISIMLKISIKDLIDIIFQTPQKL
jgi:hypothetical protein